jgi:MFS family permease
MVVIIGYQLYDLARRDYGMSIAHASFMLGVLGFVQFVPMFLMTPVAGVVADRFDRRKVGASAVAVDVGMALTLALSTQQGWLSLPLVLGLGAAHGLAKVFIGPSVGAIAPMVVPPALLPRAVAMNSMAMQSGTILGPAVAGLLFAWSPGVLLDRGGLLACSIALLLAIRPLPAHAANRKTHPLKLMGEGFAFVRGNPFLLGCITLDLFAVLLAGPRRCCRSMRATSCMWPHRLGQMRAAPALGAAVAGCSLVSPAFAPCGGNDAGRGGGVRAGHGGVWRFAPLSAFAGAAGGAGRGRHAQHVRARQPGATAHARCDARARFGDFGLAIGASNELGEMESGLAAAFLGATGAGAGRAGRGGGDADLGGDLPADPPCRQVYPRGGLIPMLEKIPYTDGPTALTGWLARPQRPRAARCWCGPPSSTSPPRSKSAR